MTINNNDKQIIIMIMIVTMTINNKDNYIQIIIKEKKRSAGQENKLAAKKYVLGRKTKQKELPTRTQPYNTPSSLPLPISGFDTKVPLHQYFLNNTSSLHPARRSISKS